ncbi:hypothetical protein OHA85_17895 [Nocardia salmonicida]|nr:hypothetical protein [Nocardia salmonicida]
MPQQAVAADLAVLEVGDEHRLDPPPSPRDRRGRWVIERVGLAADLVQCGAEAAS